MKNYLKSSNVKKIIILSIILVAVLGMVVFAGSVKLSCQGLRQAYPQQMTLYKIHLFLHKGVKND